MKDDTIYLRHILECIRRIEVNVAGRREPFLASHTLQDAVLRNLQTMIEPTQRLSDTLKTAHPDVEWRRIIALWLGSSGPERRSPAIQATHQTWQGYGTRRNVRRSVHGDYKSILRQVELEV